MPPFDEFRQLVLQVADQKVCEIPPGAVDISLLVDIDLRADDAEAP